MEPRIKAFVESDAGAEQFIARYAEAVASPEVRQAYDDWVIADFRERSLLEGARMQGRAELEGVVADKNAALADKDAALADKDATLADKDAALAEQAALIASLRAQLGSAE
jgi:hypothetical protein